MTDFRVRTADAGSDTKVLIFRNQVVVTPTGELGKVLTSITDLNVGGYTDLPRGIQVKLYFAGCKCD